MTTIGKASVYLFAHTAKFNKGMQSAGKTVKAFGGGLASAVGKIGAFGGALLGLAGAGSMTLLVKNSMSAIDKIAKFSDETGVSTEALTSFAYAAQLTGTKQDTLTKGMQRMVRRLGEAKIGYGQGVKGLDALGLSADELVKKSPDEALKDIAEATQKLPGAAERAAAAYALFGRQGQEMMNFLLAGRDGISSMQKEAEKLGLTYSRIDAAKVEAANDAMVRLGSVMTGIGNQLTIQLTPYIAAAANKFAEMAASGEGMGKRVVGSIKWVAESIARGADFLNLFVAGFETVKSGMQTLVAGFKNGFAMIEAAAYGLASVVAKAMSAALSPVGKAVAELEFQATKTWNFWKRVTGKQSAADEIKAMNAAQYARRERIAQFSGAGSGMAEQADILAKRARAALESGLSGSAGAEWDKLAKASADNAVAAYDKFANGAARKQVTGFFDAINNNAQKVAEDVAANAAKLNAPREALAAAPGKIESRVAGSFSAASLLPGGKIEKDQLATQQKMLKELQAIRAGFDEESLALAG